MKHTLQTILIVILAIAVVGGALYAGWAFSNHYFRSLAYAPGAMGRGYGMRQPGSPMMSGGGFASGQEYCGRGRGMMGGYARGSSASAAPLSIETAEEAVNSFLEDLGIADLKIHEIMIFDNHAYAEIVESSTGIGAIEVLVDPSTLQVYPEHGPNMMWNNKYGGLNHSLMMGGWSQQDSLPDVSVDMHLDEAEALSAAQDYLDSNLPGALVADEADPFYGYYTIHILRNGEVSGMLGVNGYSGQVFLHSWHGNFIEMSSEE